MILKKRVKYPTPFLMNSVRIDFVTVRIDFTNRKPVS